MGGVWVMGVDAESLVVIDSDHFQAGGAPACAAGLRETNSGASKVNRGAGGGSSATQLRGDLETDRIDPRAGLGRSGRAASQGGVAMSAPETRSIRRADEVRRPRVRARRGGMRVGAEVVQRRAEIGLLGCRWVSPWSQNPPEG